MAIQNLSEDRYEHFKKESYFFSFMPIYTIGLLTVLSPCTLSHQSYRHISEKLHNFFDYTQIRRWELNCGYNIFFNQALRFLEHSPNGNEDHNRAELV